MSVIGPAAAFEGEGASFLHNARKVADDRSAFCRKNSFFKIICLIFPEKMLLFL